MRAAGCGKPLRAGSFFDRFPRGDHLARAMIHTLEAALWASLTTAGFEDGAAPAVNLGDDVDVAAAAYGGLAGAQYEHVGLLRDFTRIRSIGVRELWD